MLAGGVGMNPMVDMSGMNAMGMAMGMNGDMGCRCRLQGQ
jgi:hypothetical protein